MIILGSSFLSPAHGTSGARANIKNTIARLLRRAKRGWGWEAARPCVSKEAKPAKIVSLIEKIFCARPLKEKETFAGFAGRRQAASRWVGLPPCGRQSKISVRILFKISSNFVQKTPPVYDFSLLRRYCLALASLGLGKSNDFIRIFEIKKQFSLQNLEVRFAEDEHKLKNLLTNLFCSAKGGTQSGNFIPPVAG